MRYDDDSDWGDDPMFEKHPACRCGCGELLDECPRASWLGAMIRVPAPNPFAAKG